MRTNTKRYLRILAIVAATVCGPPVHAAWQFTSVDFPGAVETNLFGVNDSGDAVGFAFDALSPVQIHPFAFVYTDTGVKSFVARLQGLPYEAITISDASLLEFPGMAFTIAEGINNKGDVIGVYLDANFETHGFVAERSSH